MVDWFDVKELAATGLKTLLSGWFGDFADRREVQAALDVEHRQPYYDLRFRQKDGVLWFDYLSDTGDGFIPTYSVAWSASRPKLVFGDGFELPRPSVLVLGGDQVYPTPEMNEYNHRFRGPFTSAYAPNPPQVPPREEETISCFALPGNHDWYDGLTNFLRLFCQGRRFGLLQTCQTRSYFALRLTEHVWLWAVDSQLSGELDKPQKDYFCAVARDHMAEGDEIIFVSAQPTWIEQARDPNTPSFVTITWFLYDYVYNRRKRVGKTFRVRLLLTGDLHHYSRYGRPDQDLVLLTAGGAGAFAHLTHALPSSVAHLTRRAQKANVNSEVTEPGDTGTGTVRNPANDDSNASQVSRVSNAAHDNSNGGSSNVASKKNSLESSSETETPRNTSDNWNPSDSGGATNIVYTSDTGSVSANRVQLEKCFPSRRESLELLQGNLWWFLTNGSPLSWLWGRRSLVAFLGLFFDFQLLVALAWPSDSPLQRWAFGLHPSSLGFAVFTALFWLYFGQWKWYGAVHGLVQSFLALFLLQWITDLPMLIEHGWPVLSLWMKLVVLWSYPFAASACLGWYLFVVSRFSGSSGAHETEASSSLACPDFKNFLRVKVDQNSITVYPIGIRRSCRRWVDSSVNPDYPLYQPEMEGPQVELIEEPIVIQLQKIGLPFQQLTTVDPEFADDSRDDLIGRGRVS